MFNFGFKFMFYYINLGIYEFEGSELFVKKDVL